jgi:hypothetical protein
MSEAIEFYNFKGEKVDLNSFNHHQKYSHSWNTIFAESGAGRAFSVSEMDRLNSASIKSKDLKT